MKTTIEIPDPLFRRAKSRAAERGQTLKQLVTDALREKLANDSGPGSSAKPAWMRGFGELSLGSRMPPPVGLNHSMRH